MNAKPNRLMLLCAAGAIGALVACSPQDRTAADTKRTAPATSTAQSSVERGADNTKRAASDTAITAKVKSALLADEKVKGMKIDVETKEGTVTLTGTATSPAEKEQAERLAAAVEGVRNVVNRISVS
jgi:hyperosmotically inducible periplasmic protein